MVWDLPMGPVRGSVGLPSEAPCEAVPVCDLLHNLSPDRGIGCSGGNTRPNARCRSLEPRWMDGALSLGTCLGVALGRLPLAAIGNCDGQGMISILV